MWEFNAQGVTINLILIWSYLKLNALSLYYRAFFILPDYYFSQVSVPVASCSHLRFPAISLSLSLTHILPAFPLCPLASPWPPVIQGNWSSHHVITVVVLSQCQAAIMKPDWLQPHPQNWQPGSVAPPPTTSCCVFKQPYSLAAECRRHLNVRTAQVPGQAVCVHRAVWTAPQCSDGWMKNKL